MQHTKKTVHDLSITFHCSLPCYSTIFRTSPSSRSSSKTKAAYMITLSVPLHLLQSALLFFFRHLLIKQIWFFHTLLTVLRGLDLDLEWSLPLDVDLERFLSELLERRRELLEWWWDLLEWWWDPLEWWWDPLEWWWDSFSSRRLLLELSGISIPFSAAIYAINYKLKGILAWFSSKTRDSTSDAFSSQSPSSEWQSGDPHWRDGTLL